MPSFCESPLPIFVVHWNRPAECLKTIGLFQQQGTPVSIRVVDNGSRPDCLKELRNGLPASVELMELAENKGWGGGLNVCLRRWLTEKGSDYCIVSAHDSIPKANCLALLVAAMEHDKSLGMVCPQYEAAEVLKFRPIRGITTVAAVPRPVGQVTAVEMPHATILAFRKQCLAAIGLFDERYFAYGDEVEIGLRARKNGWTIGMVWGAVVINPGTWTSSPVVGYLSARSSLLMAADYGGMVRALIRAALMFVNSLRLLFVPAARNSMSSPRARLMAIRDFLMRRFGPIPASLIPKPSVTASGNPADEKRNISAR